MALTRHRNLRTGTSVWMSYRTHVPQARRLQRDLKTDVLVVGAGISGILLAYSLASRGTRVAVVDRRGPLKGSTLSSTALLQFEIDTPLIRLQRKLGARNAQTAWLRSLAALRSLHDTIRRTRLRVALEIRPSMFLAGSSLDARALAAEAHARQRIGLPSQYVSSRELRHQFGLRRSAAIVSEGNLEVDPRALAAGLLRLAMGHGTCLFAPHEIIAINASSRRVRSHTADGYTIESRQAVFCTGYEMPKLVPMQGHSIASTWAMATRAQARALWPQRALLWEASDPYLYVRATADGRVICGGEDESFSNAESRDARIAAKTFVLQRKLHALLPQLDVKDAYA
jgi:glycine/D-amino acid oxidase-like deaminating enzyme